MVEDAALDVPLAPAPHRLHESSAPTTGNEIRQVITVDEYGNTECSSPSAEPTAFITVMRLV